MESENELPRRKQVRFHMEELGRVCQLCRQSADQGVHRDCIFELFRTNRIQRLADWGRRRVRMKVKAEKYTESQNHGLAFEDNIRTSVFGLDRAQVSYTYIHDVPKERNRFDSNENISIKTTGGDTLYMGSALRIFDYAPQETHTAIVVQYLQDTSYTKRLKCVYELNLDDKQLLFGSVSRENIVTLANKIKEMPHNARDKSLDADILRLKKELNAKSGILQFNPKIDSRSQRRLQCSIPKFASYPSLVRSVTTQPIVRGIRILAEIVSTRRVRNRRI